MITIRFAGWKSGRILSFRPDTETLFKSNKEELKILNSF